MSLKKLPFLDAKGNEIYVAQDDGRLDMSKILSKEIQYKRIVILRLKLLLCVTAMLALAFAWKALA